MTRPTNGRWETLASELGMRTVPLTNTTRGFIFQHDMTLRCLYHNGGG